MGSAAISYEIEPPDKKAQFEIEPPKTDSTVMGSVKKGLSNVFYEGPKSIYHAFADPAQPGEADVSGAPWERGARAFNRILVDPSLRTQEKARAATNPVQKAGYYGASAFPGSEWISSKGEQAGSGDIKGAAIETGTTLLAPHVAGTILRNTVPLAKSAKVIATPPARMALEAAKDIPVVRGAIKGATAFKGVPGQLRNIWNPQPGVPGVDVPGGVPPTEPNPQAASTPYRMAGEQIPQARTVTPRAVAPVNRQLRSAPPEGLPSPESPAPAPYRLSGPQIPEAATATPRRIIGPERQLGPAPAEVPPEPQPSPLKAKTPQAAQTEIFKKMGVAAPKASLKPMESVPAATQRPAPWMTFGNKPMAGETAARMQLTHTSINALRSMALERGLKVTPGASSQALQNAIAKSLTPEEIEGFEHAASERMQPDYSVKSTGEAGVPSPSGVQLGKAGPHINDYTGEPIPDSPMAQHEIIKNGKVWGKVRVNPGTGEVTVNPEIPSGVENPAEFAKTKRGELGVSGVKKLMGDLKEQYPNLEEASGKKANIRSNPGSTQRIKFKPMTEGPDLIEGLKQMKTRKK